jgi:hypothetical protein
MFSLEQSLEGSLFVLLLRLDGGDGGVNFSLVKVAQDVFFVET